MNNRKKEKAELSENNNLQPHYWRSLAELHNDPNFKEASRHEFLEGVTNDFHPSQLPSFSRRKFLALLGASAALAAAGCSDYHDKGEIVPYTSKPEEILPGKANYYASSARDGSGILIKTREGRPIKVDGNSDHPVNRGKVSAQVQADILNLYDSSRIKNPLKRRAGNAFTETSWKDVDNEIIKELSNAGGKEIAIITKRIISPATKKVLDGFAQKYPGSKVYSYELFSNVIRNKAWQKCYSSSQYPLIKWDEAKIIISLDADFLGTDGDRIENSRLFAIGRDVKNLNKFNRLYTIEGNMSITGMNSDYRIRLRPDAQLELIMGIINELGYGANSVKLNDVIRKYSLPGKTISLLLDDVRKNKGKAIFYAGRTLPESIHIAVNYLNEKIGAVYLYRTDAANVELIPLSDDSDWQQLIDKMNNSRVAATIHFDSNPVYHLPKDLGYENALLKVSTVISLTETENESSVKANYTLPINHPFEAWGDVKIRTGFYSLQQPVIAPIFNTRQKEAVLLTWLSGNPDSYNDSLYHQYLRNHWQNEIYPTISSVLDFKQFWYGALHDGIVLSKDKPIQHGSINSDILKSKQPEETSTDRFIISLRESYNVGDGQFAGNGWLQELPHPVSKITWDNYAALSAVSAERIGVKNDDLIEINIDGRKLELPIFIQPGAADDTITIELGFGRKSAGVVGTEVGFNANVLLSKNDGISKWIYSASSVQKVKGRYNLVTAQEHHAFDNELLKDIAQNRGIIREGTVEQYKKNPRFLHEKEKHELHSFYTTFEYTGVKWGMAIDLNKCLGCGDCIIACGSENNIPVVGKDQVAKGREMHWLRIDRYYSGSPEEPVVSNQPMLCQHCDQAPCENVCPVTATTHSPDGLNQMVYNRCVGTRYCSNNCPYKVRRFNFFNFRDHFKSGYQEDSLFSLIYNPEVTVRSRGVMEKCTFCIQRIAEARQEAINENRSLKGSDVKTACQDACPTNAIVFGDMNDKESELTKFRNHELGYYLLEETNSRPNVTYIAKLRNTHPEKA
jgi:molybdopterin-containing oxidoreductase family iron-sulfur binding subunit